MRAAIVALGASMLALPQAQAWWKPPVDTTWQIVLSKPFKNTSEQVDAADFDLFDNPASTIQALHQHGHKAICYFSAGSWENWRPDAKDFKKSDLGRPLAGWPGERWLNTNSPNVRKIMQARMDLAVKKNCDAIDPDNIDAYDNGGGGFNLNQSDAVSYVKFLAAEGHKRGMGVSLKNGGAIIGRVLSDVDFAVNEQCLQYHECDTTRPFITAGKPVFHIEYVKGTPTASYVQKTCSNPTSRDFSTLIKHLNLGYFYVACPAPSDPAKSAHSPGTSAAAAKHPSTSSSPKDSSNSGGQLSAWQLYSILLVPAALFWQL